MTKVLLGLHSLKKQRSCQKLKVTQTIPYPGYNKATKNNDMMLLRVRWWSVRKKTTLSATSHKDPVSLSLFQLKRAAKQTKTVKYLQLGSPGKKPRGGSSCLVAGWGLTENNEPSDVLLSANVTVVDRKKCSKYYNSKIEITKEMICAGSEKVDTCRVGCV